MVQDSSVMVQDSSSMTQQGSTTQDQKAMLSSKLKNLGSATSQTVATGQQQQAVAVTGQGGGGSGPVPCCTEPPISSFPTNPYDVSGVCHSNDPYFTKKHTWNGYSYCSQGQYPIPCAHVDMMAAMHR
jgi:hypothetical protein